ncbi:MAG: septum formation initiator family protein [Bacteroides sp.]|nr:septum formation initiator family protein [Prevotella sp.]MCM1407279.1 septum formation initiator family protein [Treponema brennaborense]MCM1469767.1 septum formation initiator family protein [Bacteroides sp.]
MNKIHLLAAVFCGMLVYVFLSVVCGQNGILAERQLAGQQMQLNVHLSEIRRIHDELQMQHDLLSFDADVISAYARKIGFVYEGEKIVKISGLAEKAADVYDAGTPWLRVPLIFMPEWICKCFGVVICILLYFLIVLDHIRKEERALLKNHAADNDGSNA